MAYYITFWGQNVPYFTLLIKRGNMKLRSTLIESPRAASKRTGWPEKRLRKLIAEQQIRYLKIGGNYFLPEGAVEEFVELNSVEPCQKENQ